MMFHLTNSMFKSVMPNVNDVMKQNPGLVGNMMSAVQNTMTNQSPASSPSGDRSQLLNYFIKKRLSILTESIGEF